MRTYQQQDEVAHRNYVRACMKRREFFRGRQYLVWDEGLGQFATVAPGTGVQARPDDLDDESLYVVNMFQGFALTFCSVMTASQPGVTYFPRSARSAQDVAAAKAAESVVKLFESENRVHEQQLRAAYYLWTDGTIGSYVRYRVDGQKYGYDEEPLSQLGSEQLGPASYSCPACGQTGPMPPPEAAPQDACPACGAQLPEGAVSPPQSLTTTQQTGTRRTPRGQEVRDVVGGLELSLPPNAREMSQFPYLIWSIEVDRALAMATYPEAADEIRRGGSGADTAVDSLARRARIQITSGKTVDDRRVMGPTEFEVVTLQRAWLRPFAFWKLEDEDVRNRLLQLFPEGVRVVLANDVVCEAAKESMDDHWSICHALPGDGQIRESVGASLVPLQEIGNDVLNMERDTGEFGASFYVMDPSVISPQEFQNSRVRAGAVYSARAGSAGGFAAGIWQSQPARMAPESVRLREELFTSYAQFLSGLFPAVYGGDTGGNDTAHGIAIERDQAMGRVSLYWRALKEHWAEVAGLVVKEFAKNRTRPVTLPEFGDAGQYSDVVIDPADLKGGEVRIRAEAEESYPTTWPQRKNTVSWLMSQQLAAPVFQNPENWEELQSALGMDLEMPGQGAWRDQLYEIDKMLQGQGPLPVHLPPNTPPDAAPPERSSIPVQPLLEDHQMHLAAIRSWWAGKPAWELRESARGGDAKAQALLQDVVLHAQAHQAAMAPPPPQPGAAPAQGAPLPEPPGAPPPGPQGPPPPGVGGTMGGPVRPEGPLAGPVQ